jgi:hypothetical protein
VSPATFVAALVGGQLRVAIGTHQPEISSPVVGGVAVDVVQDQNKRLPVPKFTKTADGTDSTLLFGDVSAHVMAGLAAWIRDASRQPNNDQLPSFAFPLTSIAAIDPGLAAPQDRTAAPTLEHE